MHLDSHLLSLDPLLLEAFLISNNSKETRDICLEVPAISKPVTLAGVTAPMGCSMDICPTILLLAGVQPQMSPALGYWFHSHCCTYSPDKPAVPI